MAATTLPRPRHRRLPDLPERTRPCTHISDRQAMLNVSAMWPAGGRYWTAGPQDDYGEFVPSDRRMSEPMHGSDGAAVRRDHDGGAHDKPGSNH